MSLFQTDPCPSKADYNRDKNEIPPHFGGPQTPFTPDFVVLYLGLSKIHCGNEQQLYFATLM